MHSSTTLLTYARAGIGDSETPLDPAPRSVGAAAEELRRLLAATDLAGPFILVGHSIGVLIGLIVVFAEGGREDHLSFDVVASADEAAR